MRCNGLKEVQQAFDGYLFDYVHNHGHTICGTVKFFDWVYNRSWDKVLNRKIEFLAK